jgi:hypothetical protein
LIRPRTPWHNGKVERSHRNDQERFYNDLRFYSFSDLQTQMKRYLYRSNNIPMAVLGWKIRIRFKRSLAGDDLSSTRRPDSLSLIIFSSFWSHIIDKYTVPKKFLPVSHRNSSTYFARKFKPPDLLQSPKDLLLIKIFVKPTVRIGILSDQRLIEIEQAIQSLQISLNCSVQHTFKILLRHVPSPSCNALRNAQSARECLL